MNNKWHDWCKEHPPECLVIAWRKEWDEPKLMYSSSLRPEMKVAGLLWRFSGIAREQGFEERYQSRNLDAMTANSSAHSQWIMAGVSGNALNGWPGLVRSQSKPADVLAGSVLGGNE